MFPYGNMTTLVSIDATSQLGELVRRERQAQGILQEDLALAAGTGRRFIIDLEAGKPTIRLASALAVLQTLGLSIYAGSDGDA
jgi:y4mF family transcriptional regulator